jgi:hypothetical protein
MNTGANLDEYDKISKRAHEKVFFLACQGNNRAKNKKSGIKTMGVFLLFFSVEQLGDQVFQFFFAGIVGQVHFFQQ